MNSDLPLASDSLLVTRCPNRSFQTDQVVIPTDVWKVDLQVSRNLLFSLSWLDSLVSAFWAALIPRARCVYLPIGFAFCEKVMLDLGWLGQDCGVRFLLSCFPCMVCEVDLILATSFCSCLGSVLPVWKAKWLTSTAKAILCLVFPREDRTSRQICIKIWQEVINSSKKSDSSSFATDQSELPKLGCRDGAVVRALTSHQCGPGSIPPLGVICGLSLLVLYFAPIGFLRVVRFPLLKNQHLTWFAFIVNFTLQCPQLLLQH